MKQIYLIIIAMASYHVVPICAADPTVVEQKIEQLYADKNGKRAYYLVQAGGEKPLCTVCHIDDQSAAYGQVSRIRVRTFSGGFLAGLFNGWVGRDKQGLQDLQEVSDCFFSTLHSTEMQAAYKKDKEALIAYVIERARLFGRERFENPRLHDIGGEDYAKSTATLLALWTLRPAQIQTKFYLGIARYSGTAHQTKETVVLCFDKKQDPSDAEITQSGLIAPLKCEELEDDAEWQGFRYGMHAGPWQAALVSQYHDSNRLVRDMAACCYKHADITLSSRHVQHGIFCINMQRARDIAKNSLTAESYPELYKKEKTE